MRVTVDLSAFDRFLSTAGRVGSDDPDAAERAWRRYEDEHSELFASYFRGWGSPGRRAAAADRILTTAERLHAANTDWRSVVHESIETLDGLVPDVEVPVVVFVGMGTSNGWVTTYRGHTTLFLAAEQAPPAHLLPVLVAHEGVHAVQQIVERDWDDDVYTIAASTFAEGLATYASTLAVAGLRDDQYLWFDDEHEDWHGACVRTDPVVRQRLSEVLSESGREVERRFFMLSGDHSPTPQRFGYFAGLDVVRRLARLHSLDQLLRWDRATASRAVARSLFP